MAVASLEEALSFLWYVASRLSKNCAARHALRGWADAGPLPSRKSTTVDQPSVVTAGALTEFMHIGCAVSHVVAPSCLPEAGGMFRVAA